MIKKNIDFIVTYNNNNKIIINSHTYIHEYDRICDRKNNNFNETLSKKKKNDA